MNVEVVQRLAKGKAEYVLWICKDMLCCMGNVLNNGTQTSQDKNWAQEELAVVYNGGNYIYMNMQNKKTEEGMERSGHDVETEEEDNGEPQKW